MTIVNTPMELKLSGWQKNMALRLGELGRGQSIQVKTEEITNLQSFRTTTNLLGKRMGMKVSVNVMNGHTYVTRND